MVAHVFVLVQLLCLLTYCYVQHLAAVVTCPSPGLAAGAAVNTAVFTAGLKVLLKGIPHLVQVLVQYTAACDCQRTSLT